MRLELLQATDQAASQSNRGWLLKSLPPSDGYLVRNASRIGFSLTALAWDPSTRRNICVLRDKFDMDRADFQGRSLTLYRRNSEMLAR